MRMCENVIILCDVVCLILSCFQKTNEHVTKLFLPQDKWHVDDLEEELRKKIEVDANTINRFVNANHIDFSPSLYAETTNDSIAEIERRHLQKTILP